MVEVIRIRGHHLEQILSDLNHGRENPELKSLELSHERVCITDTYDDFCNNICRRGCNDVTANLPVWDRAFATLYGFTLNKSIEARCFIKRLRDLAKRRTRFAVNNLIIGEEEKPMSYSEVVNYLSQNYFDTSVVLTAT